MSNDEAVRRAAGLDTATISDALDRLGIAGQCLGIKPRDPAFRLAGRAFTVRYRAAGSPPGTVGDFIDDVPAASVIVLDNAGREDATVWGDILTMVAHTRKLGGTVIDGACRDVQLCLDLGYPVFSRSHSMRTGKDRVEVDEIGRPITIGGASVEPGDLLRGDADGVVVIPKAREAEVLAVAEEIHRAEEEIRAAVTGGLRLDEARRRHRYHRLQTRSGGER
jgi:4-hydroxy-4-methyl-2-oxoglutarate aldolase